MKPIKAVVLIPAIVFGTITVTPQESAAEIFKTGDQVTLRQGKEQSDAQVVISARNSDRLVLRLNSSLGAHIGLIQLFRPPSKPEFQDMNGATIVVRKKNGSEKQPGEISSRARDQVGRSQAPATLAN
ncbi:hypothetical protein JQ628_01235 [Bradyrhizobium lablabi]|uniref:hypothetical protein n=1 Tax=Bradyrhizobium lablabi TaxID=722472 RepID=UPI001BA47AF2|nr:hypothetical protein [Bradyrhizobium lablabi]MBR1120118.1 hypothetical protein [Bradyrhizobium lablabi]